MRIGLLIFGSLEQMSGGYLYDRFMKEALEQRGHEVRVFSQPGGSYSAQLRQNHSPGLEKSLLESGLDVLVQDELNHPALFRFNRRLKKNFRAPVISLVHHLRSSEPHPALWKPLYRSVESAYLKGVDGFIFNTRTTKEVVSSIAEERPHVVALPGCDRLGERISKESLERRLTEGRRGPLRLFFLGNLGVRKGLHVLVEALGSLKGSDWLLDVVGKTDGEKGYFERIVRLIDRHGLAGRIRFHGIQNGQAVRESFLHSDLFVLPSAYEGFGIVYAEAAGFGLPSLASAHGGASEVVRDGQTGWLAPYGNAGFVKERLSALMTDRELLERSSLRAWEAFSTMPTWKDQGEAIARFLENFSLNSGKK